MRHFFFCCFFVIFITSCKTDSKKNLVSIDQKYLLHNLEVISHDSLEGRLFGSKGNHKTQNFIAQQFKKLGIPAAFTDSYIQSFPYTFEGKKRQEIHPIVYPNEDFSNVPDTTLIGGNVVAMLPGKIEKSIVVTGHLDHLGVLKGRIYNGADDDASGAAALLTIAKYFKKHPTKHTLIFAAVDGEEVGSLGCDFLLDNFPTNVKTISLNINMDMIGRNDDNEIYACGLYHYPQLKTPLDGLQPDIKLLYGHDDPYNRSLEDWTDSSDHREFHKRGIPFVYFGVEDHKDYHKPTDTFENIQPEFYTNAVKLVIQAIAAFDTYLD